MEEQAEARYIINTLVNAGFVAYYAGGWVRDFLMNHPSDDMDIATSAPPEAVQSLFPRTVPIGIQFGIVLVLIGEKQYEVATFRQDVDYLDGRRPSKIVFSSAEEDAKRRDFTINGMFYDPIQKKILDYVQGRQDLEAKIVRAIGDPHERIREDRLRMIRAVRLACRFRFLIEHKTKEAIVLHAKELFPSVAIERVVQELEKGCQVSILPAMLFQLHELSLLGSIFPNLQGLSVEKLRERIERLHNYPKDAPLMSWLVALFPGSSLQEQVALCKRLKMSKGDEQFMTFLWKVQNQVEQEEKKLGEIPLIDWIKAYAHPSFNLVIQIVGASFPEDERDLFLEKHRQRVKEFVDFIHRIRVQNPVVKAKDLEKEGILPGPLMGRLLKEAEKISINERLEDPVEVIEILKKLPVWRGS